MEISFENPSLRQLCQSKNRAKTQFGEEFALKLKTLLADLDIWNNVNELIEGGIYNLKIDGKNSITIELGNDAKFVFCAINLDIPLNEDRTINWAKVTRIKVLRIEVNNEKG